MAAGSATVLPNELIAKIVGSLPPRDLVSCMRVSRTVANIAAPLLYGTLKFPQDRTDAYPAHFENESCTVLPYATFIRKLHILKPKPSRLLMEFVRSYGHQIEEILVDKDGMAGWAAFPMMGNDPQWRIEILKHTPNLQTFQMIDCWWLHDLDVVSCLSSSTSLLHLTRLHVQGAGLSVTEIHSILVARATASGSVGITDLGMDLRFSDPWPKADLLASGLEGKVAHLKALHIRVSFSHHAALSDSGLLPLLQKCTNLRSFFLDNADTADLAGEPWSVDVDTRPASGDATTETLGLVGTLATRCALLRRIHLVGWRFTGDEFALFNNHNAPGLPNVAIGGTVQYPLSADVKDRVVAALGDRVHFFPSADELRNAKAEAKVSVRNGMLHISFG
ncbi:hypothetical protein M427DRAFT_155092 [Gonapodya prolifera JEL478]|uniref:F-box domain-containing protein n=1 Tax=Gonapodya prolifera (strain JEL478) TaxID=1344416 RepID=A0A139AGC0_GONPJ|nr:hypothetical protein M427DRAFT_155092 [Gonapodya prolifera JEL478]|eukprot:KXS15800.1 hypothetical protein M427DRAFT_155092 [Gonapodya prolifera JEL478]